MMRVPIALMIVMNAAILTACTPKVGVSARCTPSGVETTEYRHPSRGSLVSCLSNTDIEMVAVDNRGLWWLDGHALTLLPRSGPSVHVTTIDAGIGRGIAIDVDAVYVPTYDRIKRTNLAPSAVSQDIVVDQLNITAIAVDDMYVFWTVGGGADTRGSVHRWPKRGGPVEVVAGDQIFPGALVIDEKNLYWSTSAVRKQESSDLSGRFPSRMRLHSRVEIPSRLMTVPKAGGSVRILGEAKSKWSTDLPEAKLIDDPREEIAHIAADSTHVYWTTMSPSDRNATIWQTSKAEGTTTALATMDDVRSLALTNTHVYVATSNGLFHIRKTGGTPQKSPIEECFAYVVGFEGIYCATSYLTSTGVVLGRIEHIREE